MVGAEALVPQGMFCKDVLSCSACATAFGCSKLTSMPWRQDFTSAVMDVDYSPTGREFVAGSYDRSLRIFGHTGGRSREVSAARRHCPVLTLHDGPAKALSLWVKLNLPVCLAHVSKNYFGQVL